MPSRYHNKISIYLYKFMSPKELVIWAGVISVCVYISSLNYLLYHTLAELFTIIISCSIALIVINTRKILDNGFFLFLGISFAFSGMFDLLHILAYQGMGVFPQYGTNLAPQMWLIARFIDSIALMAAGFFLNRKFKPHPLIIVYSLISLYLLCMVFYWRTFPTCFVDNEGLTAFKINSEYLISTILVFAIFALAKNKHHFHAKVYRKLIFAYLTTIATELSFTSYVNMYGLSNMIGHIFKLISYYFLYMAIVETSLREPYNLLFYKLTTANKNLQLKTEELNLANKLLHDEISERTAVEQRLQYISYHDVLTGLYNRSYFENYINKKRDIKDIVSLIAIDIDGLKKVNDSYGHQAGDKLIKSAADLLVLSFFSSHVIARVGGDEFVVILPQEDLRTANELVIRLENNIKTFNSKRPEYPVSLSIGCACSTEGLTNFEELYKLADNRMYQCKKLRKLNLKALGMT
ncbi:sensor domain-containing diguanylate cyclase [Dendrosporobacter sp. 1207_IL3150]|uniref:sensor domain-containing diguanylate cyclase n=1 Tax=Dendrosporobacter sp. 1207_IL3150 TaxID=3084054 RepID=UPI002FD9FB03